MIFLYNGHLQTLDLNKPVASALAIQDDRIVAVGSDDEILALAKNGSDSIDLESKAVWPGLTDAHIHLEHYTLFLQMVDCETLSRAECLQRVRERASQVKPGEWIRGHGWNQNSWAEGFGDAALLDTVAPNHAVYLTAKSLHAAWANSLALKQAGITAATPDPEGGLIQRGPDGNPTGILLESAMALVEKAIPLPTVDELRQELKATQTRLWQFGITGVHDFDRQRCFSALQLMDQQDELRLRVVKSIPYEALDDAVRLGLRSGYGSPFLKIGSVKMFADGALGPRTAAMFQPYEGEPTNRGILLLNAEMVVAAGEKAVQSGLGLAIHAIGDRANREVLDGYAHIRRYETRRKLPHLRHRIEHVQVLHPQDSARLARLQVIASVQPIHATSDMFMADHSWGDRSSGAYAFRTLISHGTAMAFGSDAPVESPNPMKGIHAAVTRRRADGQPGPKGWYPDQRLTMLEALQGFTTGPAYAAGLENCMGRIAPGYAADLIILPFDPFSAEPDSLLSLQPIATMVAGRWVWGDYARGTYV